MAGDELLAHWREAGAWWAGEPPLEVYRWRTPSGRIREDITRLRSPWDATHPTESGIRPAKTRDEKVRGKPTPYAPPPAARPAEPYAPLHLISGYSFGESVLFAEEIPRRLAKLGLPAGVIRDRFSLTGAFEFAREARTLGIKPLIGATLELDSGGDVGLIARSALGYRTLSRLLTECHLSEPRLFPLATLERLACHTAGLFCLTGGDSGRLNRLLAAGKGNEADTFLRQLIDLFGRDQVWVELERSLLPWERGVNAQLKQLAEHHRLRMVAGGPVSHATADQFPVQDVLLCAETLCQVDELMGRKPTRAPGQPLMPPAPRRALNAERYLRNAAQQAARFADCPEAIANTLALAAECDAWVLPGRSDLPCAYENPAVALHTFVEQGLKARFGVPDADLRARTKMEVERINRMGFAPHFLVMYDTCRWAKSQNILFSGRGSVVDSVVAYCLGLTRIDAHHHNLLFDRFLPGDGSKRPDIDIDFEAKRRNDIRNYLIRSYRPEHVATVAAVGSYNTRGIVREVGKALGIPESILGFLAKRIHGGISPKHLEAALEARPELMRSGIPKERFTWVFRLAGLLADIPRNMRAHSSGVVISTTPIADLVPVMWSAGDQADGNLRIIQWDKRSSKHVFDKFDILCLRGQDVLSGTQSRVCERTPLEVDSIPLDDEETYRAMRSGQLIGIPQSASPAMRQAHMRLQTKNLDEASLVQAGIRPGVGGAVKINELIARRRGKPYTFEHPELQPILGHTYGIVVFQEQIDLLLQTFCRYEAGEAEDIREQIHKRRREDYGTLIRNEMLERMHANGYAPNVAEHVFELIAGFKGYGFAQGHALAFAEISIRSIYCQQNFPTEYFASLLSAQPAGYYGPCTLANEARARGIVILPPCVNHSDILFTVEDYQSREDPKLIVPHGAIRVGLMQIAGLSGVTQRRIVAGRPYTDFFDFCRRAQPNRDELEQLIMCGALDMFFGHRRAMLWAIPQAVAHAQGGPSMDLTIALNDHGIEDFRRLERAVHERLILGLDVAHHLVQFERERIRSRGGLTTREVGQLRPNQRALVVGAPIRLRFPPTPSGKRVLFFDLEDESGLLNVTCFDAAYRAYGHAIVCSPYVTLRGVTQDRDGHTGFLVHQAFAYTPGSQLADYGPAEATGQVADFLVG